MVNSSWSNEASALSFLHTTSDPTRSLSGFFLFNGFICLFVVFILFVVILSCFVAPVLLTASYFLLVVLCLFGLFWKFCSVYFYFLLFYLCYFSLWSSLGKRTSHFSHKWTACIPPRGRFDLLVALLCLFDHFLIILHLSDPFSFLSRSPACLCEPLLSFFVQFNISLCCFYACGPFAGRGVLLVFCIFNKLDDRAGAKTSCCCFPITYAAAWKVFLHTCVLCKMIISCVLMQGVSLWKYLRALPDY